MVYSNNNEQFKIHYIHSAQQKLYDNKNNYGKVKKYHHQNKPRRSHRERSMHVEISFLPKSHGYCWIKLTCKFTHLRFF